MKTRFRLAPFQSGLCILLILGMLTAGVTLFFHSAAPAYASEEQPRPPSLEESPGLPSAEESSSEPDALEESSEAGVSSESPSSKEAPASSKPGSSSSSSGGSSSKPGSGSSSSGGSSSKPGSGSSSSGGSSSKPGSSSSGSGGSSSKPGSSSSGSGGSSSKPESAPPPKPPVSSEPGTSIPGVGDPPVVGSDKFKVVAYYPSWKPKSTHKLQYDVTTHVIYAFAIPTEDGGLLPLENPQTARQIIADAHRNGNKVLLAVGGWSYQNVVLEPTFNKATETAEKRRKFHDAIIEMCEEYGFDGIDMDWEHPRTKTTKAQYEDLMLQLSDTLHSRGKLLTAAVLAGVTPGGYVAYDAAAQTDKVLEAVDWVNVMAYDGGDGKDHSSYEYGVMSGNYWRYTRKMPAEKVVLGVPFYARPSWKSYAQLLEIDSSADQKDIVTVNGVQAYYNGVHTIQRKTQYAKEHLGGMMVWEVTQDTADRSKSLLSAIGKML